MTNGFTTEEIVLQMQEEMRDGFRELHTRLDKIAEGGCATGISNKGRIDSLEKWRDRGLVGIIALAIGLVLALLGLKV